MHENQRKSLSNQRYSTTKGFSQHPKNLLGNQRNSIATKNDLIGIKENSLGKQRNSVATKNLVVTSRKNKSAGLK